MITCKKCGISYSDKECDGMFSSDVIVLCDKCHEKWKKFYDGYKNQRFKYGIPFNWINYQEQNDRAKLFKQWIKPTKVGCYWCKYRKGMLCSGYSLNNKLFNHKVCGYGFSYVNNERDLLKILNIKIKDWKDYGKPYGYLCDLFKSKEFIFR